MTRSSFDYTITTEQTMLRRGMNLTCHKCGKPIHNGDKVHSKIRKCLRDKSSMTYYHESCWESLFI